MSRYLVKKTALMGTIAIPPSKSQTLRAILFASLAHGKSVIYNYLSSSDTESMVQACRSFGAVLTLFEDRLEVEGVSGKIAFTEDVIHAGNSGIILRFCSAVGALASHPVVVTGDYSIRHQRPMKQLLSGLSQLGVFAVSMRGDEYAPVIIQGPIKPSNILISGEDSQPVSALLIASAFAKGPIEITVENPGEKPWVALTLDWFTRLGISYENHECQKYRLFGNASYQGFEYTVPGDLSSAAFPVGAALVTSSEVTLSGVDLEDLQGDKELFEVFRRMGACIEVDKDHKKLHVRKGGPLKGAEVDINDFIDALPILAVVACFADGTTHIQNASIAKQKECNRIAAIAAELKKMGADIQETEDGLMIHGSHLRGSKVHSYQDHRLAMALTIAGLGALGETEICHTDCIAKTFPDFLQKFNQLGTKIEVFS